MPTYIHQSPHWPSFRWDAALLAPTLDQVRFDQGRLLGRMESLGFPLQQDATLKTLTADVLKSSEIEGEHLNADVVRSSIARRLRIDIGALKPTDRSVEGVVAMMLDATQSFSKPLTAKRLFGWHASLFPTGRTSLQRIRVGKWRNDATGPMQVVSGAMGKERVHFEAPAAIRLPQEMKKFLAWFNQPGQPTSSDWLANAAIAHLWFVTIHPFDDGNGRIARAIADMALARSEKSQKRFYSMSAQIRLERNAYYQHLEDTQRSRADITPWMLWFFGCLHRAIQGADLTLKSVLAKARFWERAAHLPLNPRHKLVLNLLLDNFEGKLTTSKWALLTKSSQDTAARDIQLLVENLILTRNSAGGRSTSYSLVKTPAK